MLHNTTQLYAKALGALDCMFGRVKDLYFDDATWDVRYLVADTGTWLAERLVLITPQVLLSPAVGTWHGLRDVLRVKLTRDQLERSPRVDTHRPISRRYAEQYPRYRDWAQYWAGGGAWGIAGYPVLGSSETRSASPSAAPPGDLHLRSTKAITGYRIHGTDGKSGHVRAFTVDDATWKIRDLIVEVGPWYAKKKVRILPSEIERISYEDATVFVNLSKEEILAPTRHAGTRPAVEALS